MRNTTKTFIGICICCLVSLLTSCSPYTGTYSWSDSEGRRYEAVVNSNGTATVKLTSAPASELKAGGFPELRKGISGTWDTMIAPRGHKNIYGVHITAQGRDYYLIEGYVHRDYWHARENNTSGAHRYNHY